MGEVGDLLRVRRLVDGDPGTTVAPTETERCTKHGVRGIESVHLVGDCILVWSRGSESLSTTCLSTSGQVDWRDESGPEEPDVEPRRFHKGTE